MKWVTQIVDVLLPRTCVGCGQEGQAACLACWNKWCNVWVESWPDVGLKQVISCGAYRQLFIQRAIQRWKFAGDRQVATELAFFMNTSLSLRRPNWLETPTVIVPIPLHPRKLRERGFNQTLDLAMGLSQILGLPVLSLLQRVKYTQPQKSVDEIDKLENLRLAFSVDTVVAQVVDVKAHCLVLDDIATTGTTLREAAQCLQRAGFSSVSAVVLARG